MPFSRANRLLISCFRKQEEQPARSKAYSDPEALLKPGASEGIENDQEHQRKIDAARDLYYSLERRGDTAHRLIFQVCGPRGCGTSKTAF